MLLNLEKNIPMDVIILNILSHGNTPGLSMKILNESFANGDRGTGIHTHTHTQSTTHCAK